MGKNPTVETEDLHVTLRQLSETRHGEDKIVVLIFEIENRGGDLYVWRSKNNRFLDNQRYQYEPPEIIFSSRSESSGMGFDSDTQESVPEIELAEPVRIKEHILPGAKVLCATDIRLPSDRELQTIFYDYDEDGYEYKLDLSSVDTEPLVTPIDELQPNSSAPGPDESADSSDEQPAETNAVAKSSNFKVEISNIVTGVDGKYDNLLMLTFEVKNIGDKTKKWWYDEHVFVDSEGYGLATAEEITGFTLERDPVPEQYVKSAQIPPGAIAKTYTDVNVASGRRIEQIFYDYQGEEYELTIGQDIWDDLKIEYDRFTKENVSAGEASDDRVSAMVVEDSPETTFDDIGGLDVQKRKIREVVRKPLEEPTKFEEIGITPPEGVLLHGPPGTGKTMLARAVANEADATFIKLAAPELARAFLGEGANLVRDCFDYARSQRPAIIFIDEIDAIATRRQEGASEGTEEIYRTMLQLLSEMDGFENDEGVRVLAATNRINRLDEAILRPGRFDRVIEVPVPDSEGLKEVFAVHIGDIEQSESIDIDELATKAEGMNGAEVEAVCTEAGYTALRSGRTKVTQEDFFEALSEIQDEMDASESAERYVQ